MTPEQQMTLFYTFPTLFSSRQDPARSFAKGLPPMSAWYPFIYRFCHHLDMAQKRFEAPIIQLTEFALDGHHHSLDIRWRPLNESQMTHELYVYVKSSVDLLRVLTTNMCPDCGAGLGNQGGNPVCYACRQSFHWPSQTQNLELEDLGEIQPREDSLPESQQLYAPKNDKVFFNWEHVPGRILQRRSDRAFRMAAEWDYDFTKGWEFRYYFYGKTDSWFGWDSFHSGFKASFCPKPGQSILTDKEWIDFGLIHFERTVMTPAELIQKRMREHTSAIGESELGF